MDQPLDTIHVNVEYYTGMDEGDVGYPYFVAFSDELHFTTDGESFEELLANIREVLILCLHDMDSIEEYNVLPNAKVKIVMELPENYAQTA
jgi:predicted RNase H-like HicB family nuclease